MVLISCYALLVPTCTRIWATIRGKTTKCSGNMFYVVLQTQFGGGLNIFEVMHYWITLPDVTCSTIPNLITFLKMFAQEIDILVKDEQLLMMNVQFFRNSIVSIRGWRLSLTIYDKCTFRGFIISRDTFCSFLSLNPSVYHVLEVLLYFLHWRIEV